MNYEIFLNKVIYFNKTTSNCQIYDLSYLLSLDNDIYEFKIIDNELYQIIGDKMVKLPILYKTTYYDDGRGHSPIFICKSENYFAGTKTDRDNETLIIEVRNKQFVVTSNGTLHKVGRINYDNNKFTLNGVLDLFRKYGYLDRLIKLE